MSGNLINTADIRGFILTAGGTSFQLLTNPPKSTSSAYIQTTQQGVGFNQNLTLQASAWNVGIGITNPNTKLYVNGNTTINGNVITTGQLQTTNNIADNNPIYITSTNTTANNCIQIKNNSTYAAYIGIGGTALDGNYANNLFIESASSSIILNTDGRTSASIPNLIAHSTGKIGIGSDLYHHELCFRVLQVDKGQMK
jgi:hypothetical protein